jgi:hypothetical protein
MSATETLDVLFSQAESRLNIVVGQPNPDFATSPNGPLNISVQDTERDLPPPPPIKEFHERDSVGSSGRASSRSSGCVGRTMLIQTKLNDVRSERRLSRETAPTSVPNTNSIVGGSAMDLERRLSTDRVLDLFTMGPKVRICALPCFVFRVLIATLAMPTPNQPSEPTVHKRFKNR